MSTCRRCGRHEAERALEFSLGREQGVVYKYVEGRKRAVKQFVARRLEMALCRRCHRRFRLLANAMLLAAGALFLIGLALVAGCFIYEQAATPLGWLALLAFGLGFVAASLDRTVSSAVEWSHVRRHPRCPELAESGYNVLYGDARGAEWHETGAPQ